ncbi:MAG: hypothetical protein H6898_05170 [Rhodobacter sp.]|nr:hypothetical protein [Paracoccaceae bacterium]MCC0075962.1 hypothetical protein [Rhodobacter sp.]
MARRDRFGAWLVAVLVLVVAGGFVPYGLLADHRGWFTAGFWILFGVTVIVVIAAGVRGWRAR